MVWLVKEIEVRGGAVSFHDFMALALYHPDHGYYSAKRPRYGRHGDYLTAPSASQWYGAVLTRFLTQLAERSGPLTLVDMASGDGLFLAQVLEQAGSLTADLLRGVVSVEQSKAMRNLQQERLKEAQLPVSIGAELPAGGPPAGVVVVHASELYDAIPVHRLFWGEDGIFEQWVEVSDGELRWCQRPAPPELHRYFVDHGVELRIGQLAEVNLKARPLHSAALEWAGENGLAVVLDYGYEAQRLYDSRGRFSGSLACYRDHRLSRDPLAHPGEQDMTAHVNWDDLRFAAHDAGWTEVGLWPLAEFLVRGGIADEMEQRGVGIEAELTADTYTERQEIKRLLDPEGMGADLRVLVQARGPAVDLARAVLGS
jgi:SAM-dependent MidA family methyltransferase